MLKAGAGLSEKPIAAVGARIQRVRFRLDRTVRTFAALLGVAPETVERWEAGAGVDRNALILIADMTDTSMEWLIAGLTPAEVEAVRKATVSGPSGAAVARTVDVDEPRFEPRAIVMNDEDLPQAMTSVWEVRREHAAEAGAGAEARRVRPLALMLEAPGFTLVRGARAPTYRLNKTMPEKGQAEIKLSLVLEGRRRFEQRGRTCEGGEGSAVFVTSVDGASYAYGDGGRYVSLCVPEQALRERVPRFESRLMRPIAPDSRPLRLLSGYVSTLMRPGAGLDREAAQVVAEHFVDLCVLLFDAKGDERALAEARGLRAALESAVCEAIEAGAATPGFSARSVAERLDVTERCVHDLLRETDIWFWDRVNARRLDVMRSRLADPTLARSTIAELAFACGFSSDSRFDALFEARFGQSPSAYRAKR